MHTISETDHFLILASDGVFEFLSSQEVLRVTAVVRLGLWYSRSGLRMIMKGCLSDAPISKHLQNITNRSVCVVGSRHYLYI